MFKSKYCLRVLAVTDGYRNGSERHQISQWLGNDFILSL